MYVYTFMHQAMLNRDKGADREEARLLRISPPAMLVPGRGEVRSGDTAMSAGPDGTQPFTPIGHFKTLRHLQVSVSVPAGVLPEEN